MTIEASMVGSLDKLPLFYNKIESNVNSLRLNPNLGLQFNWNDIVDLGVKYSPSFISNQYSNTKFEKTKIFTQNMNLQFIIRSPNKIVFESYLNYRYNSQVALGLPKENIAWNAAVSKLIFKEDRGQIKFSIYDLLNRNNNFSRIINANSIIDSRTNVLQRYVTLTLIYNVRPAGRTKEKIGGRQSILRF